MTPLPQRLCDHIGLVEPTPDIPVRQTGSISGEGFVRHALAYEGREEDTIPASSPSGSLRSRASPCSTSTPASSTSARARSRAKRATRSRPSDRLSRRGVAVLAPDAISFERRREPSHSVDPDDADWLQQYNAMVYRLLEVVPHLAALLSYDDLLRALAPRPTFVVSGTDGLYAVDADAIVEQVGAENVRALRVEGEHALDAERLQAIVDWVIEASGTR